MDHEEFHLEKAPIVEAIIAIDIAPSLADESMSRVEAASEAIKAEYPESEPLRQVQFQFGVGPGMVPFTAQPAHQVASFGQKHVSSDKRQLVVFRRNGFNFSRLPPYQRWAAFRDEAKRLWNVYRTATGPVPIARYGLRYINRVQIPLGQPVDKFLNLYPELPSNPDGSLRTVNSSYIRVDSMLTEIDAGHLIIQQASLPQPGAESASLSLDFDISVTPKSGASEVEVWQVLETARRVKNQLFKASLKPEFLETFR